MSSTFDSLIDMLSFYHQWRAEKHQQVQSSIMNPPMFLGNKQGATVSHKPVAQTDMSPIEGDSGTRISRAPDRHLAAAGGAISSPTDLATGNLSPVEETAASDRKVSGIAKTKADTEVKFIFGRDMPFEFTFSAPNSGRRSFWVSWFSLASLLRATDIKTNCEQTSFHVINGENRANTRTPPSNESHATQTPTRGLTDDDFEALWQAAGVSHELPSGSVRALEHKEEATLIDGIKKIGEVVGTWSIAKLFRAKSREGAARFPKTLVSKRTPQKQSSALTKELQHYEDAVVDHESTSHHREQKLRMADQMTGGKCAGSLTRVVPPIARTDEMGYAGKGARHWECCECTSWNSRYEFHCWRCRAHRFCDDCELIWEEDERAF